MTLHQQTAEYPYTVHTRVTTAQVVVLDGLGQIHAIM